MGSSDIMNIFILHSNPRIAAQMAADCHVVKMPIESWQMLSGQFPGHPCSQWISSNGPARFWLYDHAVALCEEYTFRFGKTHAIQRRLQEDFYQLDEWRERNLAFHCVKESEYEDIVSTAALAMPHWFISLQEPTTVASYRRYYINKSKTLSSSKFRYTGRKPPQWLLDSGFVNPV